MVDASSRHAQLCDEPAEGADMLMFRICRSVTILLIASSPAASAADLKDMVGKWRWQSFTIEVKECQGDSVCAKVIAGSKNVGMDVFASKLVAKNGEWFGQITHPETKEATTPGSSRRIRTGGNSTAALLQRYA
jgi:hypothetical protein